MNPLHGKFQGNLKQTNLSLYSFLQTDTGHHLNRGTQPPFALRFKDNARELCNQVQIRYIIITVTFVDSPSFKSVESSEISFSVLATRSIPFFQLVVIEYSSLGVCGVKSCATYFALDAEMQPPCIVMNVFFIITYDLFNYYQPI